MDGGGFDRLTRSFAHVATRRGLLALAGVLGAGALVRVANANQLGPASCAASGSVCTMLMGCCDGLTCVTSAINTNYGVCVAGDGGTMSVGTTLISPFSEEVEQEVAAIAAAAQTASSTSVTDAQEERKAEKDARQAAKKSRRQTKRNDQQSRNDTQHDRKRARRLNNQPTPTPTQTTSQAQVDLVLNCVQDGSPQSLTIRNLSQNVIEVARIESLLNQLQDEPFTPTEMFIEAGTALQLQFGGVEGEIPGAEWLISEPIFQDSPFEGARVELEPGRSYRGCCDGTRNCLGESATPTPTPTPTPRNRKKRKNDKKKKKKR